MGRKRKLCNYTHTSFKIFPSAEEKRIFFDPIEKSIKLLVSVSQLKAPLAIGEFGSSCELRE